jgi:hypothetical protein
VPTAAPPTATPRPLATALLATTPRPLATAPPTAVGAVATPAAGAAGTAPPGGATVVPGVTTTRSTAAGAAGTSPPSGATAVPGATAVGSGGAPSPTAVAREEQSLAVCDRSQAAGPRALRIKPSEWEEYRRAGATQGACAAPVAAGAPSTAAVALPAGGQASVAVGQNVVAALQAGQPEAAARVLVDAAPPVVQPVAAEVLGGGRIAIVDAAIDIKFELRDAAGAAVPPAADVGGELVALTLPHLPVAEAGAEFHWLHEVFEGAEFLGYAWSPDETVDAEAGTVTFTMPVAGLQGTVFLPAAVTPGWVQNHDPLVHTWSGPTVEARDFGFAGPQWTTFTVVAPQVRLRLFVWSPVVSNYAWIDVAGVGPAGPPPAPTE